MTNEAPEMIDKVVAMALLKIALWEKSLSWKIN